MVFGVAGVRGGGPKHGDREAVSPLREREVEGPCSLSIAAHDHLEAGVRVFDDLEPTTNAPVASGYGVEVSGVASCAVDAWRGRVEVAAPDTPASRCQTVAPEMHGWVCGEEGGSCYAHPAFPGLRVQGPFTGGSPGLPTGREGQREDHIPDGLDEGWREGLRPPELPGVHARDHVEG